MIGESVLLKTSVTATLSAHNRQKLPPGQKAHYSSRDIIMIGQKGAYVPPHLRNKNTDNQNGGNKKNLEHAQSYKSTQKPVFRRSEKQWRTSEESVRRPAQSPSHFQTWNKKTGKSKIGKERRKSHHQTAL